MNTMDQAATQALRGETLDIFLRDTEALIEQEQEANVTPHLLQATLVSHLGNHLYRVDNLDQLGTLFNLWLFANDVDAALDLLDTQEANALAAMPPAEREDNAVRLAFWRVRALRERPDDPRLPLAADNAARRLGALPGEQQSEDSWNYLADLMRDVGQYEHSRKYLESRYRLAISRPGRQHFRVWDDAVHVLDLGRSHLAEQNTLTARKAAQSACSILLNAADDQEIDHEDWLRLAPTLVELDPECFAVIAGQVRRLLPESFVQARRRDVEVRLARLEASSLYRRGQLAAALEKSAEGRFGLTDDDDDSFSATVLDWLIEAGRLETAAELAFECAFMEREGSMEAACRHAQHWLDAAPEPTPYWALTLAHASQVEELSWVAGDEDPRAFYERHLARARQCAPQHPAADLIEATHWPEHDDAAWHKVAPLLERAAQAPEWQHSDALYLTYLCRMHEHGPQAGLALPMIAANAAGWNYDIGVKLNYNLEDEFPDQDWSQTRRVELIIAHYEAGLQRFEAFFASGRGSYRDGDVHVYSMLCNNLAIKYRDQLKDYDKAIVLHRKGIATSPFAEHYYGIMWSLEHAGRYEEFVEAAEQLWHFAAEYGFSRHNAAGYIREVALALNRLERGDELPIWLQRLEEWWSELDEEAQSNERGAYFNALVTLLINISWQQPADALARLQSSLPALRAEKRVDYVELAGRIHERAGQYEQAIALYEEALALPFEADDEPYRDNAREYLEDCRKALGIGEKKPWWKFWN